MFVFFQDGDRAKRVFLSENDNPSTTLNLKDMSVYFLRIEIENELSNIRKRYYLKIQIDINVRQRTFFIIFI